VGIDKNQFNSCRNRSEILRSKHSLLSYRSTYFPIISGWDWRAMFKAALSGIGLFRHRPYKMESHHSSGEPICNNFVLHVVGSWSRSNFIRSSAGVLMLGHEKLGGSHKGSSRLPGDRFVVFQSALCLLCSTLQRFFILFFKHVCVCIAFYIFCFPPFAFCG
jgi:hypothetical protein